MRVPKLKLSDTPQGFQVNLGVWRKVDLNDGHVNNDLHHREEGPEKMHFSVEPESYVQLDNHDSQ